MIRSLRFALTFSLPLLSGCSVFMAAQGQKEPNISILNPGTKRAAVDEALGRPISFERRRDGDLATYQYFTGDPANYRRAAAYAFLDGITLGLAELVTFPAEAVQGDRHVVQVLFSRSGHVAWSREAMYDAPIDAPEKLVGLNETLRPNDQPADAARAQLEPAAVADATDGNHIPRLFDSTR